MNRLKYEKTWLYNVTEKLLTMTEIYILDETELSLKAFQNEIAGLNFHMV